MVYKFFDKKSSATRANKFAGGAVKNKNMSSKELAEELHKPFIRNIEKRKSYSSFKDNVWGCLSSRYTIN